MRARFSTLGIAMATVLCAAGCGLPVLGAAPSSGGPTAGPFPDVAALATAMRSRQLSDRTVSFSSQLTYDGGSPGYSGDGAFVITASGTDLRFRIALADGRAGELVMIGRDVFLAGFDLADSGSTGPPWRRLSVEETLTLSSSEQFHAIVLTQLDSLDEAFVLRGSSVEVRGDRPVTEYRLSAGYLEAFEIVRRHLDLGRLPAPDQVELPPELRLNLAVDGDSRLVEATFQFDVSDSDDQSEHDYAFSGWGQPVDVSAPPPELVAAG